MNIPVETVSWIADNLGKIEQELESMRMTGKLDTTRLAKCEGWISAMKGSLDRSLLPF